MTSQAIAFSLPIKPNFSVVFPLILTLSFGSSHSLQIFFISLFLIFFIFGVWVIIFISKLLME